MIAGLFLLFACNSGKSFTDIAQRGYIQNVQGIKIVHLYGTPYEMGYEHGRLLKTEIRAFYTEFFEKAVLPVINRNKTLLIEYFDYSSEKYSGDNFAKQLVLDSAHEMEKSIPERYIEEMKGIADGSGLPYDEILIINTFPDVVDSFLEIGNLFQALDAPFVKSIIFPRETTEDGIDNNGDGVIDAQDENVVSPYTTSPFAIYRGLSPDDSIEVTLHDDDGVDPERTKVYLNGELCEKCPLSETGNDLKITISDLPFQNGKLFIEIDSADKKVVDSPPPPHTNAMRRERFLLLENRDTSLLSAPNFSEGMITGRGAVSSTFGIVKNNNVMVGRNFIFMDLNILHLYTYLFVYHPDSGNQVISAALPGMVGVLTGINDRGLFISANQVENADNSVIKSIVDEFKVFLSGVPADIAAGEALEDYATSISAEEFLKSFNIPSGWNFFVADKNGNLIAVERDAGVWGGAGRAYSPEITKCSSTFCPFNSPDELWVTGDYVFNLPDIDYDLLGGAFHLPPQNKWAFSYFSGLNTFYAIKTLLKKEKVSTVDDLIPLLKQAYLFSPGNTIHSLALDLVNMDGFVAQGNATATEGDYVFLDFEKLFNSK